MQARLSGRLVDMASAIASSVEAQGGRGLSAVHAALLASRLFEAIKAERAALDPSDCRTRALLDDLLGDCERLAQAGDRLTVRLNSLSRAMANGLSDPRHRRLRQGAQPAPPTQQLRLFQVIEGGNPGDK